ncbi:hypothetical protein UCRPC4_g06860 [Phaeomoniella chlamydospora]|uniref:DUF1754-domain-containing protein n=1 Tax=Phaeomoniella chlamydospora TaxID=158046 RepID=A0A0G2DSZ1_PHACM|nr:hypothetical protein UCRPC4_g06860 [Phaeomoniella chlamydospora]
MPSSDYTFSTGKLKLKGVSTDAKISKKKKKHRSEDSKSKKEQEEIKGAPDGQRSSLSKALKEDDTEFETGRDQTEGERDAQGERVKTEAERRWEEQRRRRLDDRLKREGVKSHKERVEELNRYLSKLSEHHDMPKIGPG